MHFSAGKVLDEEEILTRDAPPLVQHDEDFFELCEPLAAAGWMLLARILAGREEEAHVPWIAGFADIPRV